MIIKEFIIGDDEDMGVQATSLVDEPAILENFEFFNKVKMGRLKDKEVEPGVRLGDFYEYTASPEPEIIDTSHEFCRKKAGFVYHISEINAWGNMGSTDREKFGFNLDSNFFKGFNGNTGSFQVNQQIYNCRHWLRKVNSINDIPKYKQKMFINKRPVDLSINFKVSDIEKREIEGMVLQSGQFIYRNDINGLGEGYGFFTRETIRQLKEKYGMNRTLTIQHNEDITGKGILLDSYLTEENDETQWYMKWKIIDQGLWEVIKLGYVRGFSIEAFFDVA